MTHEIMTSQLQTPDMSCLPVGERYRLLGDIDRAVLATGIMVAPESSAIEVVYADGLDYEPLRQVRAKIASALGQYAITEV